MALPVEETDRLIAWHNISSSAIDDAIELGGLAMPSFAVKPANVSHDSYGDISVIARKESIDPQRSRNRRIFAGDAWTPVFPEVRYKINSKAAEAVESKVKALLEKAGVKASDFNLAVNETNIEDRLNRGGGDFVSAYRNNNGMKLAFIEDTGRKIVVPKEEKVYTSHADIKTLKRIAKAIDFEKLSMFGGYDEEMQYEPTVRKILRDYASEKYGKLPDGKGEKLVNMLYPEGKALPFNLLDEVLYAARNYSKSDEAKQPDTAKLDKRIDILMQGKKTQAEYEDWLKELGKGIVDRKGVRNNRELYTPSGNRRSFDALYDEYNLANIVRAMKGQPQQGRTQFLSGSGSVKGAALEEFGSIEDVRAARDRLIPEMDEQSRAAYDEFNNETLRLSNKIAEDPFTGSEMLADILAHAKTKSAIERYLNREYAFLRTQDGLDLGEIAGEIYGLGQMANKLPMEYFEAKIYDAYPFSEAAAVVVPDTMPEQTQQALKELGANVLTYKSGDNADRLEKVNSVEGARFSRTLDADYMAAVEAGDMDAAQRMVDEAAEAAGYTIRGMHGTTNFFTIFNREKANPEGDWGQGFYFTDSERDVETNYASNEGADLTNRIEHLAEMLEYDSAYENMSYEEREEIARKRLSEGNPRIIQAALRMENPVVMGDGAGLDSTFLDFNENYDEETDDYEDASGSLVDFVQALYDNASEYTQDERDLKRLYEIFEYAYDNGGIEAQDAAKMAKDRLSDMDIIDEDGNMYGSEVVRQSFEDIGFDGIVDNMVGVKFSHMKGVDRSTSHYIVFSPNQAKLTDPVTYDDEGKVIPLSERFSGSEDIRFSRAVGEDERAQMAKDFRSDISKWDKNGRKKGKTFILSYTGDVLQGLGAIESHIYMNSDKIYSEDDPNSILRKHPEMTINEIKRLPEILNDPALVLESRNVGRNPADNSRLVMFGTVKATDGRPVMCVLDLRPTEKGFLLDDMQRVNSAYTKDVDPVGFISKSKFLYADKKRTLQLLRSIGFKMPMALLQNGSMGSISYAGTNVKLSGKNFTDVVSLGAEKGSNYSRAIDPDLLNTNERIQLWRSKANAQARRNVENAKIIVILPTVLFYYMEIKRV